LKGKSISEHRSTDEGKNRNHIENKRGLRQRSGRDTNSYPLPNLSTDCVGGKLLILGLNDVGFSD
jgi:hypothetical protein